MGNMWKPPPSGFLKVNFTVAIKPKFSITSAVIGDEYGKEIAASSLKLNSSKVNVRGAKASLLATNLALSNGSKSLILEGFLNYYHGY
jgi:hypothetical protein